MNPLHGSAAFKSAARFEAPMARPHLATVTPLLLLVALAGCFHPGTTSPGLDNPHLVAYRTSDLAPQLVLKGAFKDREYDHLEIAVNGATLAEMNNTYLVSEKLNVSAFNITVTGRLDRDVYRWTAEIAVLPDGLSVVEVEKGIRGDPETRRYPFSKIIEKVPEETP